MAWYEQWHRLWCPSLNKGTQQAIEENNSSAHLLAHLQRFGTTAGLDLSDANLDGAVLDGLRLDGIKLGDYHRRRGAKLGRASLVGTSLRGAELCFADLTSAKLRRADLTHADLAYTVLDHADLR